MALSRNFSILKKEEQRNTTKERELTATGSQEITK